jgi:formylmethanofuran dehydrogenase subunit E
MATTTWKLLDVFFGLESGRFCRRCGELISASDEFGLSEAVCRPCRQHAHD